MFYVVVFLYALFVERMWMIPLMWLLAIFLIFMGGNEYRIMRHVAANPLAISHPICDDMARGAFIGGIDDGVSPRP